MERKRTKTNRFIFPVILVVLGITLLVSGCAVNPATGRSQLALMSMSTQEEIELGQKVFPQVVQKMGGVYPDEPLQAYVQAIGERLEQAGYRKDIPYSFSLVNDSTPNAFAMPGGYIAITRGLMVNLESEAQLAAVLGHEIAHVEARHSIQGLQRSQLLGLGLSVLSSATGGSEYGSLIRSSGEVAATLLDRSYSRQQEKESDLLGIDYMVKSGYNPYGAVALQRIFHQKINREKDPAWLEGLFRTHPFSREREEENRRYIESNYPRFSPASGPVSKEFAEHVAELRSVQAAYEVYDKARKAEKDGKTEEAIELYLRAAAAAPDEALILTGLGIAYLRAEDEVSAKQHLLRAVKNDDDYFLSHLGLAYIYLNQENSDYLLRHARASFDLLPTVEAAYLAGRGYEATGNGSKALEFYRIVQQNAADTPMGRDAAARLVELEKR